MDEAFLHFIWKFQYFHKAGLATTSGLPVQIIRQGTHNTHAGPDFLNAKVIIDQIEWNGSVEIHIREKDWYQHQHQEDRAYDGVVLHVVWSADESRARRSDNTSIPSIALKDRIDHALLNSYQQLMVSEDKILCGKHLMKVDKLKVFDTLDRAVVRRMQKKAEEILIRLRKNGNDWEETSYQLLAANFGFKVNKHAFTILAEQLPYKIIHKHADNLLQVEALLFGMAGFLDGDIQDDYKRVLQKEFRFLQAKYQLSKTLERHHWKFLRLRPANFPTIRLAQLARVLARHQKLFSAFLGARDTKPLKEKFRTTQSDYWLHHYDFQKPTEKPIGALGNESINNIIINTCVPLLSAYAIEKDEQEYLDRALVMLQQLPSETNGIVREWKSRGLRIGNAFDSQACIELMNDYCLMKKCLECGIGSTLIQTNLRP